MKNSTIMPANTPHKKPSCGSMVNPNIIGIIDNNIVYPINDLSFGISWF